MIPPKKITMKKLLLLLFIIPNLVMGDDYIIARVDIDIQNPNAEILFWAAPPKPPTEYRSCKIAEVSQVCKLLGECKLRNFLFLINGYSYDDFEIDKVDFIVPTGFHMQIFQNLQILPEALTLADVESKTFYGKSYIDFLHSDIRVKVEDNFTHKKKENIICANSCGCFNTSIENGARNVYERNGYCIEDSIQTDSSLKEIFVKRNITNALKSDTLQMFDEESKDKKIESRAYVGLCKEVKRDAYIINTKEKSLNHLKRSGGWKGWKQKSGDGYRFAEQYGIQDMRSSGEQYLARIDFTFSKKHGWLMYFTTSLLAEEDDKVILTIDDESFIFKGKGAFHKQGFPLSDEMINLLKSTKNDFYVKEIYVGTGTKYRTVYKSKDLKKALLWTVGE